MNSGDKSKDPKANETEQPSEDWKEQDDYLEEALEESFPASDPISPGHVEKRRPQG